MPIRYFQVILKIKKKKWLPTLAYTKQHEWKLKLNNFYAMPSLGSRYLKKKKRAIS